MTERPNIHNKWLSYQANRAYKLRTVVPPRSAENGRTGVYPSQMGTGVE
jgi:hypothetical protein